MVQFSSLSITALAVVYGTSGSHAFAPTHMLSTNNAVSKRVTSQISTTLLHQSTTSNETSQQETETSPNDRLNIPLSFDEMVKDVARTMDQAQQAGITRQIVRVLLPRDPSSAQLGQYFEDDAQVETQNLVLVPPDETWQGGIMQLYRAAAPTCTEILRKLSKDMAGVPPKIIEDRSVDDSGVDGVGLLMSQNREPKDDISCFIQPLQETVDAIESISNQAGDRLVVMVNPQWRNVDDALDSASKSEGVFGSIASFLGGKGNSLQRLDNAGFQDVYMVEGYVCKGGNVRLVKRFDSDWVIFAENDSETDYLKIGESKTRPSYQDVDEMLNKMGVSLKYARDIGLAPKLE